MDASQIRLKARDSLKGNYWPAVGVAFVAAIFGALMVNGGSYSLNIEKRATELFGDLPKIVKTYLMIAAGSAGALSLVNLILGGVVQLGYAQYLLKQQDREICSIQDLFSQFDRFGQGFLQLFLRNLYTFLWGLLFLIPGLIKSFAYAMTPFLMAEDPTLTANEAIKLSQEKMRGHKGELFCLGLSFFGWAVLAVLTGGIGEIFLNPYINAAYAAFYRDKISPKTAITFTCTENYIEQ
jgi:uncharacterized membrane protein